MKQMRPVNNRLCVVIVINIIIIITLSSFKGQKKDHWMDWAGDKYDAQLIQDIKAMCKVLFMFLPLPVFWTLFDQQGSRWVLQAGQMDGDAGQFFFIVSFLDKTADDSMLVL